MVILGRVGAFLGCGIGNPLQPAVDLSLPVHFFYADNWWYLSSVAETWGLFFIDEDPGFIEKVVVGDMIKVKVGVEHHVDVVLLFQFSQAPIPGHGINKNLHVIIDKNRTAVGESASGFPGNNFYWTKSCLNSFSPLEKKGVSRVG